MISKSFNIARWGSKEFLTELELFTIGFEVQIKSYEIGPRVKWLVYVYWSATSECMDNSSHQSFSSVIKWLQERYLL